MERDDERVPWYDLRRAQTRLLLSLSLGAVASLGFSAALSARVAVIGGWDLAALSLLASSWWIIARGDPADTRKRAGMEDPGRHVLLMVTLASSLISFFAAALLIHQMDEAEGSRGLAVALCLSAPLLAWLLTHSVYALHYAHLYYQASDKGEGLSFPGEGEPDDFDFAYFAFTVGMTFQTSDVEITTKRLRRSVLFHALLAFIFNTGVIALALNLALGKLL
jgi:uncharacterized membrane protein